jgi:hypothetical protein
MGYNKENIRDKRPRNVEQTHPKPKITPNREPSKEENVAKNPTQGGKGKDRNEKRNRKSNRKTPGKDFKNTELNGATKLEDSHAKHNVKSDDVHKPKVNKQNNKDADCKKHYNPTQI